MSSPAFVEVFQTDLRMEVTRQFPFLHADGFRWALPKSSDNGAVIFELCKIKLLEVPLMLTINEVRPPDLKTIIDRELSTEIMDLYNRTEAAEKQGVLLDPIFANVISIERLPPIITNVSLAATDPRWNLRCPLVVVTNCGACEVRVRQSNIRCYDHILVSISDLWQAYWTARHPIPGRFDDIKSLMDYFANMVITTACWTDRVDEPNEWTLYCATRTGYLLRVDIKDDRADIVSVTETYIRSIHFLKYYSTGGSNSDALLFVGTLDGICKVFREQASSTFIETATLWGVKDKMSIHCLELYFDKDRDHIVAATAKSSHFIAFILTATGELVQKVTHFVGSIVITGVQHFQDHQYIVTTINAHTVLLELNYDFNQLRVDSTSIANDLDTKSYQVLGLAATKNKAGWLFLQFPIQLYEHSFRSPTMLTICSLNIKDPLPTMEESSDKNIYELLDCAEILRSTYIKYGLPDSEPNLKSYLKCEKFDENFIRKLKIFAIILSARITYFKKKLRNDDMLETQKQIDNVRKVIEVYMAYKRLSHLATLKTLTSPQKMSGAYYRKKILKFNADDPMECMREIWPSYVNSILELLARTEKLCQAECEKCVICDDFVDIESGTCKDNHKVPRCCISFLQIHLFGARACDTCQYAAIDDDFLLKQVLCPGENICCPLCDGPLISAKSLLYLR